jgi:hypothetical protein
MGSRYIYLSLILVAASAGTVGGYAYVLPALFPSHASQPTGITPQTIIHIPRGSSIPPPTWHNFTDLSSPTFHFPVNVTVTIGVNNTIEWINDDNFAHTVTSFEVPSGASTFNSDLIFQGKTFNATLVVPGVYKYFCAWHNWLAGVITVKSA